MYAYGIPIARGEVVKAMDSFLGSWDGEYVDG